MPTKKKQTTTAPKKKSWESKELSDINKNWVRPWTGRESERAKTKKGA